MIDLFIENIGKDIKFILVTLIGYMSFSTYLLYSEDYYAIALVCYLIVALLLFINPKQVYLFLFFLLFFTMILFYMVTQHFSHYTKADSEYLIL